MKQFGRRLAPWILAVACAPHGEAPREEQPTPAERPDPPPPRPREDEPSQPAERPDPPPRRPREDEPSQPAERPATPEPGPRCFPARRDLPLGAWALNGAAADLDGDGGLDVVVNYSLDRTIEVLRGDGDGGLRRGAPQRLEVDAIGLTLADFDGDGRLDLAAATSRGDDVRVYRGEGDGRFAAQGISTRVKKHVGAGAAADLDGDGHMDLVVPLWSSVQVLRGDGRGRFRPGARLPTGQAPEAPLLVDLTGDGRLDLAVASNDEHHLALFRGRPRAGFAAIARHPCGQGGAAVEPFDLDGDGDLDLAVANIHSGDVCVLVGDGAGRFAVHATLAAGGYANAVRAADLDHDGDLDLVTLAWSPDTRRSPLLGEGVLRVFLGDGQGGLQEGSRADVGSSPNELWLADLNHDGHLEAITLNSNGRSVTVLRGDGCAAASG